MDRREIEEQLKDKNRMEYLVVKDNDFIQKANYDLSASQQKLFAVTISQIKPTDDVFERYTINAKDFAKIAGIPEKNIYRDLKTMIESFDEKAKWIKIGDNVIRFRVFSESEYNEGEGCITVMLNSRLQEYLLNLKNNFTSYELWNILSLKSKYSIRLYELFKSYEYQHYKKFNIDELKELLCAESYSRYSNLAARVIEPAVKEINQYTNLEVAFKAVQEGKTHKVVGIEFTIKTKSSKDAFQAYMETDTRLTKKNKQVPGQISMFPAQEGEADV